MTHSSMKELARLSKKGSSSESSQSSIRPEPRKPLPSQKAEDKPVYVNCKQYNGILRGRDRRAKLNLGPVPQRKPYQHQSRHDHALRRQRDGKGQFLNTKVGAQVEAVAADLDLERSPGQEVLGPGQPSEATMNPTEVREGKPGQSSTVAEDTINSSEKKVNDRPVGLEGGLRVLQPGKSSDELTNEVNDRPVGLEGGLRVLEPGKSSDELTKEVNDRPVGLEGSLRVLEPGKSSDELTNQVNDRPVGLEGSLRVLEPGKSSDELTNEVNDIPIGAIEVNLGVLQHVQPSQRQGATSQDELNDRLARIPDLNL